MELHNVKNRLAKNLSGGMLRRLGLCNAIAGSPRVLMLDEVTAGVDPVMKRRIWQSITNLQ